MPVADATAHTTTLDWLRNRGLTGAKEGCAEGECGACSVLVARPGTDTPTEWVAVNACLVPVAALDGQELVTSEGLGTSRSLHPVQRELAVRGGSQCGFCTPGFVCSMAAEYYRPGRTEPARPPAACDHEHGPNGFDLHALSGNLCRCTGYRPIRDAAYALGVARADDAFAARTSAPPPPAVATRLAVDGSEFRRPATLAEALDLVADNPDARVVAGSTDFGVEVNIRGVAGAVRRGRGPARRAARVLVRRGRGRRRSRSHPQRGRAPARRAGAAAGPAVPAVRLAVDPQRRHDRRQPRHRLADRRHPARAARPRRLVGAVLAQRRPDGAARPTTSPATGRR